MKEYEIYDILLYEGDEYEEKSFNGFYNNTIFSNNFWNNIYVIFRKKRNNGISLIKDNVVIEYGNAYNPNIEELVDLSKYKFINQQEISIENNIENEKDKDYPAVGEYEINVYYKRRF